MATQVGCRVVTGQSHISANLKITSGLPVIREELILEGPPGCVVPTRRADESVGPEQRFLSSLASLAGRLFNHRTEMHHS